MNDESQYDEFFGNRKYQMQLGTMRAFDWHHDSKRLAFTASRYKFVAKMLCEFSKVLEIGSGDAFFSKIVADVVDEFHVTDFNSKFVTESTELYKENTKIKVYKFNPLEHLMQEQFNAIFMLDVLEHIESSDEDKLFECVKQMLVNHGVFIAGTPSLESQIYASEGSKKGHVNCQSGEGLRNKFKKHFQNVFSFSMNDEVVHTGFSKMSHYLILIGISPISDEN
jgi:2-polyprenyl-3-methyl-5-hydroxy-6-metoxy-1,4-benzoquinol methylase